MSLRTKRKRLKLTSVRETQRKMGKKCSTLLPQVLVLLLLLCVFPASFSVRGSVHQMGKTEPTNEISPERVLYQSTKPATFKVKIRGFEEKGQEQTQSRNSKTSSRSVEKTHQSEGRRLMGIYIPNAGIRAGSSKSGRGGGSNP
ncbi:PREDICTED: uncharacterized protein LOC104760475 [Camelina sativa]|uniref:Uncharacterized protein LOC104760475 n=1 Tax=Camelina sativa TaxID=90675 RepID=A0ABM0X728_CAMSA|nr:PREDICTED: uncharacterized protein LOC104760475 [Camelina sativa]